LFKASNIPFDLQVKIGQQIEPYTIVPLLDGEARGSGTLVKIHGVHGILTAAHVVRNWEDSRAKTSRAKHLGLVADRRRSPLIEEPLDNFRSYKLDPQSIDRFGPDLAFVRIPSGISFLGVLLAKKSFFDLTGPKVTNRLIAVARNTPIAACGILGERTEKNGNHVTLNQSVIFGTEPQIFDREGYDYIDLRSRRSLEPKTPASFGGLSGSALWRFSVARLLDGEIKPYDFQVAGVAFYQLPDTDAAIATIRFHGPDSVYKQLLPRASDWVRDK
jgi:hypothetical protein